jgi:hypothetical protein
MTIYRVYVRGHGGEEAQKFPPSKDLPISMITLGQFGSTMSDEVADDYIYHHRGIDDIQAQIRNEVVIYWTKAQRDDWYDHKRLSYSKPALGINPYETLSLNLALDGDRDIGDCGVCYWNEPAAELTWIVKLRHGETILLSEILAKLQSMLHGEQDSIELFWTACMSANYWSGNAKKVSFNPTKKAMGNG